MKTKKLRYNLNNLHKQKLGVAWFKNGRQKKKHKQVKTKLTNNYVKVGVSIWVNQPNPIQTQMDWAVYGSWVNPTH